MGGDPVLIEVLRGERVESLHRGAVCVMDAAGSVVAAIGDVDRPVFPRSAVKAIQALPLVESGAADRFGWGDRELALACASHSGESEHAELAGAMLARIGLDEAALECGSHWPMNQEATVALARSGSAPSQLHNNCSGKHSGFLCLACHERMDHHGYVGSRHPVQELVRSALEEVTGAPHGDESRGTDGCSIPTYAVPLRSLALGLARMAGGHGIPAGRAAAARRLFGACMAEPFLVAGSGRADTRLMRVAPGRIFTKGGAEGVYCAALPELGLGVALKCEDGAGRAAEAAVAAMLAALLQGDPAVSASLADLARPQLTNWNGIAVGVLRPTAAFDAVPAVS